MKIALVIEHFDASRGRAEKAAVWVAGEMARRGHEVHVVCHDVAGRVGRYAQATQRASHDAHRSRRALAAAERKHDGVQIHKLKGMRLNTALGLGLFGARAGAFCRRGRFDVVHSFSVACPGDIYHAFLGVFAARQAQAEAMRGRAVGWQGLWRRVGAKRRALAMLERRALRRAKRVVAVCAMMAGQYREHYGEAAAGKVVVVETPWMGGGADQETRRLGDKERVGWDEMEILGYVDEMKEMRGWFRGHYGIGEGEKVAVFVGHDFRRKGLRYAIEAVGRTKDWKLVVVGLGKLREYVGLAEGLGLGMERDKVTGWQGDKVTGEDDGPPKGGTPNGGTTSGARVMFIGPTREMGAVYAAGDAMILPTFYEPSNVVVLEALAAGLPVVSTGYLGMAEAVVGAGVGVVVEVPGDVAGLSRGLEWVGGLGAAEREALGKRARGVVAGYSAEGFADRLEGMYGEVRG